MSPNYNDNMNTEDINFLFRLKVTMYKRNRGDGT